MDEIQILSIMNDVADRLPEGSEFKDFMIGIATSEYLDTTDAIQILKKQDFQRPEDLIAFLAHYTVKTLINDFIL